MARQPLTRRITTNTHTDISKYRGMKSNGKKRNNARNSPQQRPMMPETGPGGGPIGPPDPPSLPRRGLGAAGTYE